MIHDENPFADTTDNPARRFRGRLTSPVTIVTSGDETHRTGLTVSSLFMVDGEPPTIQCVVSPNTDLFDVAAQTGCFVVHICAREHLGLADVFAGIRPSPGGLFANTSISETQWGPEILDIQNRAYCVDASTTESGWSGTLTGSVDHFALESTFDPLIHFRGSYRNLE